ncbi:MAG: NAD-dependent epimerase/dehydratase family protein [Bacteroidota bacterium]
MMEAQNRRKPVIAIAGATGFIGRWFIEEFKAKYDFIAISRRNFENDAASPVEWRQADLYSMSSTQAAVAGADYAIYLVHSMMPSTRLNQSSFEDTDLILADNFARACEHGKVKQIIYIGGILPPDDPDTLSSHLRSRYEVEQTLGARTTPLTAIRAGIIVGPGGSSFTIIEKLVRRLPLMGCPKWAQSDTEPISLRDMLQIMDHILGNSELFDEVLEVGSGEVMSYQDMLSTTARVMGKRRIIFSMPILSIGFSKPWVSFFSDSNMEFIAPLVESLRYDMVADKNPKLEKLNLQYLSFEEAVQDALENKADFPRLPKSIPTPKSKRKERNTVRSVQRLSNPLDRSATWVARRYTTWLPSFFRSFIRVKTDEYNNSTFHILNSEPVLKLTFVEERSGDDRQLFYITGGLLDKRADHGWLEFREVLDKRYVLAAIHEFVPALPWYVYVNTQAVIHLWVMNSFNRYLERMKPQF